MIKTAENSLTSSESRVMVTDRGRNLEQTRATLTRWLGERMPEAHAIALSSLSHPIGAGISNETLLFDATWQADGTEQQSGFVLRFDPGSHQMFLDPGFERQIALIRALHDAEYPAPRILWTEREGTLLGTPFFVMERVHGRVPVSHPVYNLTGWLHDSSVAERRIVWEDAMRRMAQLHAFDPARLKFLDRAEYAGDTFQQEYEYWRAAYEWSSDRQPVTILEQALDWLDANRPSHYETGLAWGDARIGNMMFDETGRVKVVLDWEQASLAGGLHDLAWWLTMDEIFSTGIGVRRLDGLGTRDETITLWQELTGRSTAALFWHEVFACIRGATLVVRQTWLNKQARPGNNGNNNLFSRRLAQLLGWNAPVDQL